MSWKDFGYDTTKPCVVCWDRRTKLEPRFNYAVCEAHHHIPPTEIGDLAASLITEREYFEERAFSQRFLASVVNNPDPGPRIAGCLDKISVGCPDKDEFLKKDENGNYLDMTLAAMWWAWTERLRYIDKRRREGQKPVKEQQ